MAILAPFKGYRYDPSMVTIQDVVAPPFDVINDAECDALYDLHPNNIIRLIKGKDLPGDGPSENKYTRARRFLDEWTTTGILRQDEHPAIYVYEQQYRYPASRPRTRLGFMALVRLEERESGIIRGHEETLASPKSDRLSLLKACRANLSPIFSLFSEPDGAIDAMLREATSAEPAFDLSTGDGVRQRLWAVTDERITQAITAQLRDEPVIIADGHHRYETALTYRNLLREANPNQAGDAPHDYVMMMFVNLHGDGITIYPIHRMIFGIHDFEAARFKEQLEEHFRITSYSLGATVSETVVQQVLDAMEKAGKDTHAYGLYLGGDALYLMVARDAAKLRGFVGDSWSRNQKTLDVTIAQSVIVRNILGIDSQHISKEENVRFTHSSKTAIDEVRNGTAQIALLLNPAKPEQIETVTAAGERMPQKSTFFYPKLLSGLVINRFEP